MQNTSQLKQGLQKDNVHFTL